jgi:hypothetical protein
MLNLFPANRVAAIVAVLGGLAALVSGIAGVLPGTWPNVALAAAGLLTKLVTVIKFLDGAQKSEAIQPRTATLFTSGTTSNVGSGTAFLSGATTDRPIPDALPHVAAHTGDVPADEGDKGSA